jgi:RNA polymerase sigma-70 factor (ECF subfamily)
MPDDLKGFLDDLIARIAAGDREAFGELYRRCRPDIYRYAAHMTGAPSAAEDVVQDVFMAVIQEAERYRPGRSGVLPWLLGIAHNHVRRWRHRRLFDPLPTEEKMSVATDPVGEMTRARHEAAVARALLTLPPRFREVVVLCDLQELSYETAADALGCAVGTIRSRLHRGRARLARSLDDLKSEVVSYDSNRSSTYRSRA